MTIRIEDLRDLNLQDVQQEQAIIAGQLQEAAPSLDLRRGVIRDLLLHYSAILGAKNQTEALRLMQSMSIAAIQADPTLADETAVDNVASNFLATRRDGTAAGGSVTIIMDVLRDVTIPVGALFDAQSKGFATEQVYTGRANAASISDGNDRLLVARGDGTYEFKIAVVALEVGEPSQLVKGTPLVPRVPPQGFVSAVATEDFIGGLNQEDNADLVGRFSLGASAKALSARINMSAELHEQFESVINDSIIGFGDAELLRSRHSIFPVSMGNRADWYVQTQALYRTSSDTKSAVLVEITGDGKGIWQMTFGRDEYPGFYALTITPSGADDVLGNFPITEFIRGTDLSSIGNDDVLPDIVTPEEGAFTRFQTVVVQFKDTLKSTTDLVPNVTTADYNVAVQAMPLVAEIQDYTLKRGIRNTAGDVLIKAPAPCFLSLSFTVQLMPGQAQPDHDEIADDLAQFVNHIGFLGRMPSSALVDIIHNHLEPDAAVTSIDMVARLYYPDGTTSSFRDSELLEIPYQPSRLVTARTALFFLDPNDVNITFETADILQVI